MHNYAQIKFKAFIIQLALFFCQRTFNKWVILIIIKQQHNKNKNNEGMNKERMNEWTKKRIFLFEKS